MFFTLFLCRLIITHFCKNLYLIHFNYTRYSRVVVRYLLTGKTPVNQRSDNTIFVDWPLTDRTQWWQIVFSTDKTRAKKNYMKLDIYMYIFKHILDKHERKVQGIFFLIEAVRQICWFGWRLITYQIELHETNSNTSLLYPRFSGSRRNSLSFKTKYKCHLET